MHSTQTPGELVIFDFYPVHKHTTSQSASYREALANANEGKGIQPRKGGALGGYLKISALKKTAQFLYNPFKRRQHWSANYASKKAAGDKDGSRPDTLGPSSETSGSSSNYKGEFFTKPTTSAMGFITNLEGLDIYQLHNAVCPDYFNIQLAFDLYFAQQELEATNTVIGHFYHMSYYQATSPLFYAMQLFENQQFWYLFYQMSAWQAEYQLDKDLTQAKTASNAASTPTTPPAFAIAANLVRAQPMRINNKFVPQSFTLSQHSDDQALSPIDDATDTPPSRYYTDKPIKALQFFPPLDIINQYLPWALQISPSLLIPLLSSIWLSLLIEYQTATTQQSGLARAASMLSSASMVGNIMNTTAQALPQDQQVRKVARSKLIDAGQSSSPTSANSTISKAGAKGSMHVVIPAPSTTPQANPDELPELLALQDLFAIVISNDIKYRKAEGLAPEAPPAGPLESFIGALHAQCENPDEFLGQSRPLPFKSTNRLITVYSSTLELHHSDSAIMSSIATRGNWDRCAEQQSQLLNNITHYDQTTPPLFISVATYLLHAMNAANGFFPVQSAMVTTKHKKDTDGSVVATGTPVQFMGSATGGSSNAGVMVAPGLTNVSTLSYSIPLLFSILLPPQALKGTSVFGIADPTASSTTPSPRKLIDTLLLTLIKQLRQVETHSDITHAISLLPSDSPQSHVYKYNLEQAAAVAPLPPKSTKSNNNGDNDNDDDDDDTHTAFDVAELTDSMVIQDPNFVVTRLNNTLIKRDDYTALLTLLQRSYVTTITDIISSPAFYPADHSKPGPASTSRKQLTQSPRTRLATSTKYTTPQYGPAVESILNAIRTDGSDAAASSTTATVPATKQASSFALDKSNSLHHCCLTLEARLGHHRDVINLYLFTLMDIEGGLSYIRVVHQQQRAAGSTSSQSNASNDAGGNNVDHQQQQPQKQDQDDKTTPIFLLFLQILLSDSYKNHLEAKIAAYNKQYQSQLQYYQQQIRRLTKKMPQQQQQLLLSPSSTIGGGAPSVIDPSTGNPLLPPTYVEMPTWHDALIHVFSTHSHFFSPFIAQVIRLLPPSLPVSVVLPCLEQTIPDLQHNYHHNVLMANFAKRTFVNYKVQHQTMKKSYVILTEHNDTPRVAPGAGQRHRNNASAKPQLQQHDQVCVLCNRTFLEGTINVSLPLRALLWLNTNHPDVLMMNQQGQRDNNLPQPLKRNGVVDVYGNHVIAHYNCATRVEPFLRTWQNTVGK